MYIAHLSFATASKNKLEESFYEFLKSLDRDLVENQNIKGYKQKILDKYDELCKVYPRCKPIHKSIDKVLSKKGDLTLFGSNATFTLLKSK